MWLRGRVCSLATSCSFLFHRGKGATHKKKKVLAETQCMLASCTYKVAPTLRPHGVQVNEPRPHGVQVIELKCSHLSHYGV